jgi:hypothetical protein
METQRVASDGGRTWDRVKDAVRANWESVRGSTKGAMAWREAQVALRFGYSAAQWYGRRHPVWAADLEARLAAEWQAYRPDDHSWRDVREIVLHGYDFGVSMRRSGPR